MITIIGEKRSDLVLQMPSFSCVITTLPIGEKVDSATNFLASNGNVNKMSPLFTIADFCL